MKKPFEWFISRDYFMVFNEATLRSTLKNGIPDLWNFESFYLVEFAMNVTLI
jgi:hypothetical protein